MEFYKWSVKHSILDLENIYRFYDSYPFTSMLTRHRRILGFLTIKFLISGNYLEASNTLSVLLSSGSSFAINPTLLDIADCLFSNTNTDPEAKLKFFDLLSNLKLSEYMVFY